jgi:hypothetical protein
MSAKDHLDSLLASQVALLRQRLQNRQVRNSLAALGVALLLYLLGLKLFLFPCMAVVGALYVPMPRILDSWLSRLFTSALLCFSLLQIAESVQYIVLPAIRLLPVLRCCSRQ